ncbi:hypothetical protein ACFYVD_08000 [Rhodococcus pyridinivorans]|uniref:hypothetical protein n=1 Tax=Rhodococcus pyridinivorans TaxID=103816 RepID=UPI0036C2EF46
MNTPEGILTDPIPTAAQNLATLLLGDGDDEISKTFLLAEVTRGVFTAQIWRFDHVENDEPCSDPLEITFDSTGMEGGEMFHDLCMFPDQLEDFQQVTAAIMAAYRYITEQAGAD